MLSTRAIRIRTTHISAIAGILFLLSACAVQPPATVMPTATTVLDSQSMNGLVTTPVVDATLPPGSGSISGIIQYPSSGIKQIRVYAIRVDGTGYRWVSSAGEFVIDNLPAGTYYVVGYVENHPEIVGAYSQFVVCGLSVECKDHSLIPISVAEGERVTGIRLSDWYAPPNTFPPEP